MYVGSVPTAVSVLQKSLAILCAVQHIHHHAVMLTFTACLYSLLLDCSIYFVQLLLMLATLCDLSASAYVCATVLIFVLVLVLVLVYL